MSSKNHNESHITRRFKTVNDALNGITYGNEYELILDRFEVRLNAAMSLNALPQLFIKGSAARSRALHEGATREIKEGNPSCSVALIRHFAETVATIGYVADHQKHIEFFVIDPRGGKVLRPPKVTIGKMMSHVDRISQSHVSEVYVEMSAGAHFDHLAFWESFDVLDGGNMRWISAPRWRNELELIGMSTWLAEVSDGAKLMLDYFAETTLLPFESGKI